MRFIESFQLIGQHHHQRATINGSGSTLAAPIYAQWALNEKSSGLTINYLADGSGAGITNLAAKTDAFAGSDPALKPADLATVQGRGGAAVPGRRRRDHRLLQPARRAERSEAHRPGDR
jgi:ABC-type phosphate transport system substrate-binding protein